MSIKRDPPTAWRLVVQPMPVVDEAIKPLSPTVTKFPAANAIPINSTPDATLFTPPLMGSKPSVETSATFLRTATKRWLPYAIAPPGAMLLAIQVAFWLKLLSVKLEPSGDR